jgi:hypothetical protein
MTRRGQNPYSTNSSSGFSQNHSYTPSTPSYDPPAHRSYSQYEDRSAPAAKPFKTKGMQLGAKGRKNETGLAEALGGLSVEEPLLSHRVEEEQPQQQYEQPAAPTPTKDVNPFGEVEQAE